jgi:hypothetical protein
VNPFHCRHELLLHVMSVGLEIFTNDMIHDSVLPFRISVVYIPLVNKGDNTFIS